MFDVCDRLLEEGLIEAVIVVHHANVTGLRTAGSWMFEGWPSSILRLETVAGMPADRILTFEKIRAPSSSLIGERLPIALHDEGYLPILEAAEPIEAGPTLAVIIVREAGGQLYRKELLGRLMARANCRERAAAKYLGRAVQAGHFRSVRDGAEAVYHPFPRPFRERAQVVHNRAQVVHMHTPLREPPRARVASCTAVHEATA